MSDDPMIAEAYKQLEQAKAEAFGGLTRDQQVVVLMVRFAQDAVAEARREERVSWNRTKPIDAPSVCSGCGGPHPFDTSVPSVVWNRVIRDGGLPDYLCTTCIVRAFALVGESFTATLWSPEFNGLPIHVMVRDQVATDATAISEENTQLRAALYDSRPPASAPERLRCSVCDNLVDPEGHRWGCPGAVEGEKT